MKIYEIKVGYWGPNMKFHPYDYSVETVEAEDEDQAYDRACKQIRSRKHLGADDITSLSIVSVKDIAKKNLTQRDVSWAVENLKMAAKVTPGESKLLDKWVEDALK